jgi:hypothetical protein
LVTFSNKSGANPFHYLIMVNRFSAYLEI